MYSHLTDAFLPEVSGSDDWRSPYGEMLPWILGGLPLAAVAGTVCHMMPGLGGEGSRTGNRIPPAWSPENDNNYSFRAYMTCLLYTSDAADE